MENEFGFEILGYCVYCHSAVYVGSPYDSDKEGIYCSGCKQQKETYYDSLTVGDEE